MTIAREERHGSPAVQVHRSGPHAQTRCSDRVLSSRRVHAIRRQDISEAESSISYLKQQVEASPLTDLRTLFYNLIQSQTETMMLANVREEYVFKTIDPATVPEFKAEPKRIIICLLGIFSGGFIAFIYVLFRHYIRPINF